MNAVHNEKIALITGATDAKSDRCLVEVDPRYFRPTETDVLIGDPTKAQTKPGWKYEPSARNLCAETVKADLKVVAHERRQYVE